MNWFFAACAITASFVARANQLTERPAVGSIGVLADLQASYRGTFGFESYHTLFFFRSRPRPEIDFQAQLSPTPSMFEIGLNISPRFKLRLGKIFIPFEGNGPHVTYGGRVNTSATSHPGAEAFMPDYWAEYGIGARAVLSEDPEFRAALDLVLVNGLREGGTDPNATTSLSSYPSFSDTSLLLLPDNNSDKGVGGRLSARLFDAIDIGAATYRARYTNEANPYRSLWMYGFDVGIQAEGLVLRMGYIGMEVGLVPPSTRMVRGGFFAELGGQFGRYRALVRTGTYQSDSRVNTPADQQLVGFSLKADIKPFFVSAFYFRDLVVNSTKSVYDYATVGIGVAL